MNNLMRIEDGFIFFETDEVYKSGEIYELFNYKIEIVYYMEYSLQPKYDIVKAKIIGKVIDDKTKEDNNVDWKTRLLIETEELADKIHKLEDFIRAEKFYTLERIEKDLLYEQLQTMLSYIQILGKRLEYHGLDFYSFHKKGDNKWTK